MANLHGDHFRHKHEFNEAKPSSERKTFIVVLITLLTMAVEITAGLLSNSMALFADGWHMGTHAFALGITFMTYILSRKMSNDTKFAFGTWKIEILGAYSSGLILGLAGLMMVAMSVKRFFEPLEIYYKEAISISLAGLAVNIICAMILTNRKAPSPHSRGPKDRGHSHSGHDLNIRSAYIHVVSDAMTSVLAIIALAGAKYAGAPWLDPVMGIIGALLILSWTKSLLKDTSGVLLDREMDTPLAAKIREQVEADGDSRINDLHLWRVGQNKYACIISIVSDNIREPSAYRDRLKCLPELVHITAEIEPCNCSAGK